MRKLIFIALFTIPVLLFAQQTTKETLQNQINQLKKEINQLTKDLQKNQKESKLSVSYVLSLDQKIQAQTKLINNLGKEKRFIEDEIYLTQLEINKLARELSELRKEYKEVLVKAYKNKSLGNKMLFVLSSESIGQAYRRIKYLEKYSEYQLAQAQEILDKQKEIEKKKADKEKAKADKERVLAEQVVFSENLESERVQKQLAVEEFKKNAGVIEAQIREKEQKQRQVDAEIKRIIEEEIRIAKEKAEKDKRAWDTAKQSNTIAAYQKYLNEYGDGDYIKSARKAISDIEADSKAWQVARSSHSKSAYETYLKNFPRGQFSDTAKKEVEKFAKAEAEAAAERARIAARNNVPVETVEVKKEKTPEPEKDIVAAPKPKTDVSFEERAEAKGLSGAFADNKGRLPWPVDRGNVTSGFGETSHVVLKSIIINNSGVDISTSQGAMAKCVFEGTVSQIMVIPGGGKTVLIKHGNYYTTYNNLESVVVKKGDKVTQGQSIGTIYTSDDGRTVLNFQVWSGTVRQNPAHWISGM